MVYVYLQCMKEHHRQMYMDHEWFWEIPQINS